MPRFLKAAVSGVLIPANSPGMGGAHRAFSAPTAPGGDEIVSSWHDGVSVSHAGLLQLEDVV
jgi:hypothetical protein